jgi:hypothetical protein
MRLFDSQSQNCLRSHTLIRKSVRHCPTAMVVVMVMVVSLCAQHGRISLHHPSNGIVLLCFSIESCCLRIIALHVRICSCPAYISIETK